MTVDLLQIQPLDRVGERDRAEVQVFLGKLGVLDFGTLAYDLVYPNNEPGLTIAQATEAIEKYRQFLVLNYLYPRCIIVPSRVVDHVWHAALLDTFAYAETCMHLFGHFVHHFPGRVLETADDQKLEAAFDHSRQLLAHHFR
jgi:hypothetical protein